jgi:hypothetical protein
VPDLVRGSPPRSPEREALARAISRHRAAEERLRRVEEAQSRAMYERSNLREDIEGARQTLRDTRAEASGARRRAARRR